MATRTEGQRDSNAKCGLPVEPLHNTSV